MEAPPARRYRLTTIDASRRRVNQGRQYVTFTDTPDGLVAQASAREGTEVRHSMTVTTIVMQAKNSWELTGVDGSTWRISGCGCGGR